jgi:hypothetical protein
LDTLSPLLDLSTLQILNSSHSCEVTLIGHELRAIFMPISLPDSTSDYDASQGFLQYSVQTLKSAPDQAIVENNATIYFDFNSGVTTNTTSSTLVDSLTVKNDDLLAFSGFTLIPNPTSDKIFIMAREHAGNTIKVKIIDRVGQICSTTSIRFGESVSVEKLIPGMYYLMVEGYGVQKFIRM